MHSEELPRGDAKPPAGHGETGPRTREAQISGCPEMGKGVVGGALGCIAPALVWRRVAVLRDTDKGLCVWVQDG